MFTFPKRMTESLIIAAALFSATTALAKNGEDGSKSGACANGGYNIILQSGRVVSTLAKTTIAARELGTEFLVKGYHSEFTVNSSDLAVLNWTLTGAVNSESLAEGKRIVIYKSKVPDLKGAVLTSDLSLTLDEGGIVFTRTGAGVSMKIQAKDCAQGGIFQMEPSRSDGANTAITHILADDVFFFDNPNFRNRNGEQFQFDASTILTITPRINFASDTSRALVGRDSPQEATRVVTSCPNQIPNANGSLALVNHCGGRSDWSAKSGGRMGQVMGEDSIALEPAQPVCTHKCQSRSRIKGRGLNLGFPSPVPAVYRFSQRQ